jgi:predicted metal-dependent hydrolase
MLSGESHYFLGRRYRLHVMHSVGTPIVQLHNTSTIHLYVRPEMDAEKRELVLRQWYRQRLKELLPPLLEKWQKLLGVEGVECRVKRMKTKWGTCNREARRIWLNLELTKKPVQCLEYVIVHELAHLIERHHNDRFISILDQHLPQWRSHRKELNSAPLAHENWIY